MGLGAMQSALARLFTDAPLRERFATDPIGTGRSLGLDESQSRELARLDRSRVDACAESLMRKAVADLAKAIPLTHRALGADYGRLARRFFEEHTADARPWDVATLDAFAAFLVRLLRSEAVIPPWLGDLARFEAASRLAAHSSRRVVIRWFRYPVTRLAADLLRGEPIAETPPRSTWGAWLRWRPGGRVRMVALP